MTEDDGGMPGAWADVALWMEQSIGIPKLVLDSLFADDDWTLIVKLHAMIETGLNNALTIRLGSPALSSIIEKLDTSNQKTGKIAFAKALKMLTGESCGFLQRLSELRNFCVHDAKNFTFDLSAHLAAMEESKREGWFKSMMHEMHPSFEVKGSAVPMRKFLLALPRYALFARSLNIMAQLQLHDQQSHLRELNRQIELLESLTSERNQSTPKE
jgi:hypothetical protein